MIETELYVTERHFVYFFKNYCFARKKNAITFPLKSNFGTSLNTFPFDITTLSLENLNENIISS